MLHMKKSKIISVLISETAAFLRGRCLFIIAVFFTTGIAAAVLLSLPSWVSLILIVGMAVLLFTGRRRYLGIALLALAIGCFFGSAEISGQREFPVTDGSRVEVSGKVQGYSVQMDDGRYRLRLAPQEVDGKAYYGGDIIVYANDGQQFSGGEQIKVSGQVFSYNSPGNEDAFDYNEYLRNQGIVGVVSAYYGGEITKVKDGSYFSAAAAYFRNRFIAAADLLPGDQRGLINGIFLGDKSGLDYQEKNALSASGIFHAFAVSGLNICYLLLAVSLLISYNYRRRWLRLIITIVLLVFYMMITGFTASVVRAALMGILLVLAQAFDEKTDIYTSLAVALMLCLFYHPLWLFDSGFQLSFVSVFGLVALMPVWQRILPKKGWFGKYLADGMAVTFAASFAAMPLIGYYFYIVSFAGWLISVPILPLIGFALILSLIASLIAVVSVGAAVIPLYAAGLIMDLVNRACQVVASVPLSYATIGKPLLIVIIIIYLLLLLIPLINKYRGRWWALGGFIIVIALLLTPWSNIVNGIFNDKLLEVTYLDVGQGDCALVVTPDGKTVLIDGGGSISDPDAVGEYILLPYLKSHGIDRIDLMISSHPHDDHIDGLISVLENMPVGCYIYGENFSDNSTEKRLIDLAKADGTKLIAADAGDKYNVGESVSINVYLPQQGQVTTEADANNGSLLCKLSYKRMDFLFTGDNDEIDPSVLPALALDAEIVKLPHHGSSNAFDQAFYQTLTAEAVVISVGADNNYGHPAQEVVEYWQMAGVPLYRTDLDGAITVYSNGRDWQISTYRSNND